MTDGVLPRVVASEVRAEIARKGLTVRSVAQSADLHRVSLGRKLRGQSDFYLAEFIAVCAAIGVQPSVLMERAEASEVSA